MEFLNSLVELGKTNPWALGLVILAFIAVIGIIGAVGGVKWIEGKNKRFDAKREADARQDTRLATAQMAEVEAQKRRDEDETKRTETLLRFADLLGDQGQRQDDLIKLLQRMQDGADDRNKALLKVSGNMQEQGQTLGEATLTLGKVDASMSAHRLATEPSIKESATALSTIQKRIETLGEDLGKVPDAMQEKLAPIKQQIEKLDKDVFQLLNDVAEVKKMFQDFINKTVASEPAPPPPVAPLSAELPVPAGVSVIVHPPAPPAGGAA